MSNTPTNDSLETARTRLEAALSGLAQGVASSREALDIAAGLSSEKIRLSTRLETLEKENLSLHEQVASFALQPEPPNHDAALAALEHEKKRLEEQNHDLQRQHDALLTEKASIRDDLDKTIAELEGMMAEV